MLRVKFHIFDSLTLDAISTSINTTFINYTFINLPKKIKKFTFLKAPHINKKAKEHFSLITHQRLLIIHDDDKNLKKTLTFLKNLPSNVSYKLLHTNYSRAK